MLKRLERDEVPVRADFEVLHPGEARSYGLGQGQLILDCQFSQHDSLN
jgi:hypothetical protein